MSDLLPTAITLLLTAAAVWLAAVRFNAPGIAAHLAPLGVAIVLLTSAQSRAAADALIFGSFLVWLPLAWISVRRWMRKTGS